MSEKERNFEGYVIKQLDKRFEKLSIINKKDCIKFRQKAWIEKQDWREIHDILSTRIQLACKWQG
jgi:hypothetical protein